MPRHDPPEPYLGWPDHRRADGLLPAEICQLTYLQWVHSNAASITGYLELAQHTSDQQKHAEYIENALTIACEVVRNLEGLTPLFPGDSAP